MAVLLDSVTEEQFDLPTPCPQSRVGDLVDHVGTFAKAFTAVAKKNTVGATPPPPADAAHLEPGWRARITQDLGVLAEAWKDQAAWEGMTSAGGIDMPGEIAGLVAIDELVVHGWDIAVAIGAPFDPRVEDVEAAASFVRGFDVPRDGRLFGPVVEVPDRAAPFDRLLGLTGRDPNWRPPAR